MALYCRKNVIVIHKNRKVGFVTESFDDLLKKCQLKFGIQEQCEQMTFTTEDGTEIDAEYFEFVPSNSVLFLNNSADNSSTNLGLQLSHFLELLSSHQPSLYDELAKVLTELNIEKFITRFGGQLEEQTDDNWFAGTDTKYRTKESFMRNNAKSRIQSYYYLACKELKELEKGAMALQYFHKELLKNEHNGGYFDRSATPEKRLCNARGDFTCHGRYDTDRCSRDHVINPYASQESRIVFSSWNLDHVIEKSRTILPTLKEALRDPENRPVNLSYFYQLLFVHTVPSCTGIGNLKLVHIACHDKRPHELTCDSKNVFQTEVFSCKQLENEAQFSSKIIRQTRMCIKRNGYTVGKLKQRVGIATSKSYVASQRFLSKKKGYNP